MARIALAATVAALTVTACGGDREGPAGSGGSATGEAEALRLAAQRMTRDDYDGALAALERVEPTPDVRARERQYRKVAARETLRNARRQLARTQRRRESPRPAVSLAAVALRYGDSAEARRFHERAERALRAHKRRQASR